MLEKEGEDGETGGHGNMVAVYVCKRAECRIYLSTAYVQKSLKMELFSFLRNKPSRTGQEGSG